MIDQNTDHLIRARMDGSCSYLTIERVAGDRFIDFPCPLCQKLCNVAVPVIPIEKASVQRPAEGSGDDRRSLPVSASEPHAAEAMEDSSGGAGVGGGADRGPTFIGDVLAVLKGLCGRVSDAVVPLATNKFLQAVGFNPMGTVEREAAARYFGTEEDFGVALQRFVQEMVRTQ